MEISEVTKVLEEAAAKLTSKTAIEPIDIDIEVATEPTGEKEEDEKELSLKVTAAEIAPELAITESVPETLVTQKEDNPEGVNDSDETIAAEVITEETVEATTETKAAEGITEEVAEGISEEAAEVTDKDQDTAEVTGEDKTKVSDEETVPEAISSKLLGPSAKTGFEPEEDVEVSEAAEPLEEEVVAEPSEVNVIAEPSLLDEAAEELKAVSELDEAIEPLKAVSELDEAIEPLEAVSELTGGSEVPAKEADVVPKEAEIGLEIDVGAADPANPSTEAVEDTPEASGEDVKTEKIVPETALEPLFPTEVVSEPVEEVVEETENIADIEEVVFDPVEEEETIADIEDQVNAEVKDIKKEIEAVKSLVQKSEPPPVVAKDKDEPLEEVEALDEPPEVVKVVVTEANPLTVQVKDQLPSTGIIVLGIFAIIVGFYFKLCI